MNSPWAGWMESLIMLRQCDKCNCYIDGREVLMVLLSSPVSAGTSGLQPCNCYSRLRDWLSDFSLLASVESCEESRDVSGIKSSVT